MRKLSGQPYCMAAMTNIVKTITKSKEQQSALLLPKMHKEHKRQARLGNRDQQHSGKHLRAVDRVIGNHKLQPC
jgi:hypothetical protein